jgi:hypothetical protein
MRVQLLLADVALAAIILIGCTRRDLSRPVLQLEVQRSDYQKRTLAGSSLYIAALSNNGSKTATLEAVQMAGGYVGGGTYFACGLQTWNADHQDWEFVRPPMRSDYKNNRIVYVEWKPGQRAEACSWLLPSQGGSEGDCARLTIQQEWLGDSELVVSKPFIIGQRQTKGSSPCSASGN